MPRPIHLPPENFARRWIRPATLGEGIWWKVHPSSRERTRFSSNPGHRFSPPDAGFEVLYLAADVTTCLWEVFGDEILGGSTTLSLSAWMTRSASQVRVPPTRICNLNLARTRTSMGCDLTALFHNDLAIPQVWARAIQAHPASVHGLLYASRFTRKRCVALFSPPTDRASVTAERSSSLAENSDALAFLAKNRIALV